ncbi:hypothetical protein [Streptomyces sp. NPDC101776]|uniref:hypothetical protein n=1 Tax=Streptomyces sp. NPDC101776 TaxID=3366146 RepID=UPI00380B5593
MTGGRGADPVPEASGRRQEPNDAQVTRIDAAGNVVTTATTGENGSYAFTDLDGGECTVMAADRPRRPPT